MMRPKLSICIPTYNRAKFLAEALDSMLREVEEGVEIVVCDNASDDETAQVVEDFQARFSRLIYFRWPSNMGPDRNYLKSIELATGEYCWLFGSDDAVAPGAIRAVLDSLKRNPDIILGDRINMSFDMSKSLREEQLLASVPNTLFEMSKPAEFTHYVDDAISLASFFSYLSAIVVRKEAWDSHDVLDQFLGSAWIHVTQLLRILKSGGQLLYLGRPIVLNRTGNDFFAANGRTRRVRIDFDFLRITKSLFADESPVSARVTTILEQTYFTARKIVSEKWYCYRSDGHDGVRLLWKTYEETFSLRPGFAWKRLLFELTPLPLLRLLYMGKQPRRS